MVALSLYEVTSPEETIISQQLEIASLREELAAAKAELVRYQNAKVQPWQRSNPFAATAPVIAQPTAARPQKTVKVGDFVTLTKINYSPTRNGYGKPHWYADGQFQDDTETVHVELYAEDVRAIKEAGHSTEGWYQAYDLKISVNVWLVASELRGAKRIAKVETFVKAQGE